MADMEEILRKAQFEQAAPEKDSSAVDAVSAGAALLKQKGIEVEAARDSGFRPWHHSREHFLPSKAGMGVFFLLFAVAISQLASSGMSVRGLAFMAAMAGAGISMTLVVGALATVSFSSLEANSVMAPDMMHQEPAPGQAGWENTATVSVACPNCDMLTSRAVVQCGNCHMQF